jgi:nucleotide-binding universal stress UspA family protein
MYKRILVPLDGSPVAEVALDHAVELTRRFESELMLLRVVSPFDAALRPGSGPLGPEDEEPPLRVDLDHDAAETSAAQEYLNALQQKLSLEGIMANVRVLEGEAVAQILSYVESAGISLIVMSTHGRGGLKRLPFGSVASSILRQSTIPLHIVPYR